MLTIRKEQMSTFEGERQRRFGEATVAYILEQFPGACSQYGEGDVRAMVAQALSKAREYGIPGQADILRYINVMYTLGCDFDTDPRFPWAREILARPGMRPDSKIERLVARTLEHIETTEQG